MKYGQDFVCDLFQHGNGDNNDLFYFVAESGDDIGERVGAGGLLALRDVDYHSSRLGIPHLVPLRLLPGFLMGDVPRRPQGLTATVDDDLGLGILGGILGGDKVG
ncbi:MAG: hypothetical protein DDT20_01518 [Firmicutes bacterium]|nr:hypothetical protein [Bacillota bacterium]